MHSPSASIGRRYKQSEVLTATPERIVGYLLHGLESYIEQAKLALSQDRLSVAGEKIGRCQAIVWELLGSLDAEKGGNVAQDLARLYRFMIDRLVDSNVRKDPGPLDEVKRVLVPIKEGWDGLLSSRRSAD